MRSFIFAMLTNNRITHERGKAFKICGSCYKIVKQQQRTLSTMPSTQTPNDSNPTIEKHDLELFDALTPKQVVESLDKYIVGQSEAKRAVAIALRNRWRRHHLSKDLRSEIVPKNILMIGPTGCGKTEIARRIAKLSDAPFIKVEATKFTEVGFHGKDVDHMINDLVGVSIKMTKKRIKEEIKFDISDIVEEKILDAIIGPHSDLTQRNSFRCLLRDGALDDREIEIDIPGPKSAKLGEEKENNLGYFTIDLKRGKNNVLGKKSEGNKLTVKEAKTRLEDSEADRVLEDYDVVPRAISAVEESGIVFIDEIDKLISSSEYHGVDVSSEGVQRDLLPLIEGSTISTSYGDVNTDYILFIASGAFHAAKPSDLLAELQGRLPIRVTLKGLTENDMYRILTEPVTNLIYQQVELMKAENVDLSFTDGAIREIAKVASQANQLIENIGARRLHTVIERIVEEISFEAPEMHGQTLVIDQDYVKKRVAGLMQNADLRKYII